MKKLSAIITALALLTGCSAGGGSSPAESSTMTQTAAMAFHEANIGLGDSFKTITSLDRNAVNVLVFGELYSGGWSGYITDSSFADYTAVYFTPQEGETPLSAALTRFGKLVILTCRDTGEDEPETLLYIYSSDGTMENVYSLGELFWSDANYGTVIPTPDGFVINVNFESLALISDKGEYLGEVNIGGEALSTVYKTSDGGAGVMLCDIDGNILTGIVDFGTQSVTDIRKTDRQISPYWVCAGQGDYTLAGAFQDGIYALREDNWVQLSDLMDNTFYCYDLGGLLMTAQDELAAVVYSSDGPSLVLLTQREVDEVKGKTAVKIATTIGGGDIDLQDWVKKYNNEHLDDDYKIEIVSYAGGNDETHEEALSRLKMDMISGNSPDIVCFNYMLPIEDFGSRESMFVDLYDLIDKDPDLSREDFIPNILEGLETNGKLLEITPVFTLSTMVARGGIPGVVENWTFDDLQTAYENLPEGWELFKPSEFSVSAFNFMILLDYTQYVDFDSAECHFDSPEFLQLMHFVKDNHIGMTFEEFENEYKDTYFEYGAWDGKLDMREGNFLIDNNAHVLKFGDLFNLVRGRYDGDAVFVGTPTGNGQGNVLSLQNFRRGIMANSEHIDEAWDFLRTFFTEDWYENSYTIGMPVLEKYFDEEADEYTHEVNYEDELTGEVITVRRYRYGDGDNDYFEMPCFTEEECEYYKNFIKSCKTAQYVRTIQQMISDETEPYFNNERSAEECVRILQDRAATYLSEHYQ